MRHYIERKVVPLLAQRLEWFPVVAILGPRQCGKSTLAIETLRNHPNSLYIDLERPSHRRMLTDPEAFFRENRSMLICIDEIQHYPEIFTILRSVIDEDRRAGRFLLLGSASPDLIKGASESLAGRISYLELTPFRIDELSKIESVSLTSHWVRGGFPESLLAESDEQSKVWREDFIRTFLERDIPLYGISLSREMVHRFLIMCGWNSSQNINYSKIADGLGLSHTTIRKYIDIFTASYIMRTVMPWQSNTGKRLTKAPRIYIRDTGLLHSLLEINDYNSLASHLHYGSSWESYVVETILSALPAGYIPSFYRTEKGAEIDLVLTKQENIYAVECKANSAPMITRGFWNAVEDIKPTKTFIAAPIETSYPLDSKGNVRVGNPLHILNEILNTESKIYPH